MARKKKHKIARLLSFNQHKKRFGAKALTDNMLGIDIDALKGQIITGNGKTYTHGAEKDVKQHVADLRKEFVGAPELIFYHAQLIVFIRREFKTAEMYDKFDTLWREESDFLLKNMSIRWLVSASDTFADMSRDPTEKALALAVALLVNTIKLSETERFLQETDNASDNEARKQILESERVALFEGMSCFAVGTDDTLRNMRWRMEEVCKYDSPLSKILVEIFNRIQNSENVYRRFKNRHRRERTAWW